jgi:hypothetical protein
VFEDMIRIFLWKRQRRLAGDVLSPTRILRLENLQEGRDADCIGDRGCDLSEAGVILYLDITQQELPMEDMKIAIAAAYSER